MRNVIKFPIVFVVLLSCMVSCSEDESKGTKKKILSFKFTQALNEDLIIDAEGVINENAKTVTLQLPFDISRDELVPTIEISDGASVTPASEESQDFTTPISYTVTAEDGSTVVYTATITNSVAPTISSIQPATGSFNMEITIKGTNFNAVKADNLVKFNGFEAEVLSASSTQLVVKVPPGASSGPVSLTVNGGTLTGPEFRYYDVYILGLDYNSTTLSSALKVWKNGMEEELSGSPNAYATAITVSGNDVYVTGFMFPAFGEPFFDFGYWKNNVFIKIGDSENIKDISELTVSNGDVYVAGSYYDTPFNSNGNFRPWSTCYWKNGIKVKPGQDEYVIGNTFAIAVSGSDVYLGGYVNDSNGSYMGYWKNDQFISGPDFLYIRDIQLKGADIHMVATDATLGNKPITYIKNGVSQNITEDVYAMASGLAIDGDDVYISGGEMFPTGGNTGAKIWKNGIGSFIFDNESPSFVSGVMIVEGHVFTAGQINSTETRNEAFYTFDGRVVKITDNIKSVTVVGMFVR